MDVFVDDKQNTLSPSAVHFTLNVVSNNDTTPMSDVNSFPSVKIASMV